MRVLVCGGRDFDDQELAFAALDKFHKKHVIHCVIDGTAKGADTFGNQWAHANDIDTDRYPAQWNRYGKRAGFLRNTQMLEEGKPDAVIAFKGGRGTEMMCRIAENAGVKVWKVRW